MSWVEDIKNDIVITCGDGKTYNPQWINAERDFEWNVALFNYPEQEGTLVTKKKRIGTSNEIVFIMSDFLSSI